MCRIVGGFEFERDCGLFEHIITMRESMHNGGPDDGGVYHAKNARVALAHRRLSIIDLSSFAHQPFISDDGRYVLVFNGEIYNYKEIARKILKQEVQSDTEVLLKSFCALGVECVKHFDGMFAFVIWDNKEQKLYCFRDRVGVKPLYYYRDNEKFLFSSELKGLFAYPALKKEINTEALSFFFALGYIPAPLSILNHVFKLESGHYLIVSKEGVEKHCYFNVKDFYSHPQTLKQQDFKDTLYKSVSLRMVSDVPVCVLLSGGVDSSLVCAVLKDLGFNFESFSIGFKEAQFDESKFACKVAQNLGIQNHCFICSVDEAKDLIFKLPFVYDEPFGDSSAIPTLLLVSQIAQKYKVALSGDGGDELGLGYERYFWTKQRYESYSLYRMLKASWLFSLFSAEISLKILLKLGISMGIDKFLRIKNQLKAPDFISHYFTEISHFRPEDAAINGLAAVGGAEYSLSCPYATMSYFDFCNYLPEDILTKTDRAGMNFSLEIREPLLGIDFVAYMQQLAPTQKTNNSEGKLPFKQYLEQFLPHELIYRPKMGFGVPLEEWMKKDLRYLIDIVKEYSKDYLNKDYVNNLLFAFDNGGRVDFAKIWYIYIFCAWRKQWGI